MEEIDAEMAWTAETTGRARLSERVRNVIAKVPRQAFVPEGAAEFAWLNHPLPIGHGQTISQPFIVALMTDLLDLAPEDVVLEAGTGSGYQAAVLSELARFVYSVELVPDLAAAAAERLKRLGHGNVEVKAGDAWQGWPERAPFDAIIVTAAAARLPETLVDQLKPRGRLVVPIGPRRGPQMLTRLVKEATGKHRMEDVLPVAFVPFVSASA
ncbi:MAG: protein-L-isoaspartate(D-aspartate) O-methyltransferase [Proteobacteria bacterium]|nr:protein-L-isoaspartate(D-aspartate) O-methyltransferase [Pseudomonadota bacterium]MBI3498636.1 protein-L-isoaspartate(D-aspartate) O-methyltransferase [Pseudomonadota bacterium]